MTRLHNFYTDTPELLGFRPKHSNAQQLYRVVEFTHDRSDNMGMVGFVFIEGIWQSLTSRSYLQAAKI